MKNILTVAKYELLHYFVSPVAYVYLIAFIILNGSFTLYFGDLFNRGEADLLSMFTYQPWLYLLFIPGISMRLWSEEFRNKTVIQIITMPVSVNSLVWGKFLAAWLFCGLALILTFPLWLTVNLLGSPDNQVIMLGYTASFVLAGCMLAISETMSALTKNQVIALVLSVIANLFFFWSGIDYILSFCRLFFSDTIIDVIASFSFLSHFDTLTHGLLELRDVIFFASLIVFCNFTTALIVNFKTAGTSGIINSTGKAYTATCWIFLFAAFLGINIAANNLMRQIQLDATQEKIFTLSDETKNILRHLPEPVLAKLYFSPILGQRNAELRKHFDNIRILLQKYRNASAGNFDFKIYYPTFLSDEEDIALANGIQPIPVIDLNQNALFGMTIEDTLQNIQTIPFFVPSRSDSLEQEITTKIFLLNHKKKNIGIISSVPIFGENLENNAILTEPWEAVEILKENYNVTIIENKKDFDDNEFAAVILLHPQHIAPELIEAIKNYSRKGGKFLVLLDPAHEASRLYNITNSRLQSSDLDELENFWGIKFYKDYVVADLKNSITVDATTDYKENPVFSQDIIQFRLKSDDLNPSHPITRNLNEIMLASASIVAPQSEVYEAGKIKFYPLMRASDLSSVMTAKVVSDGLNPQDILQYFVPDQTLKIMAADVIGLEKDNPFELVVVGDSDFMYDAFWMEKIGLLERDYITGINDNMNFILNALDYLTDDQNLIGLRGKKALTRRFEGIETMRRLNSFVYKKQEQNIFAKMNETKAALQKIISKRNFEERTNFTADELSAISALRSDLNDYREQLGNLRYQVYTDIDATAKRIKFINIWLIPLLFALVFLLRACLKAIHRFSLQDFIFFDIRLLKLAVVCSLLLTAGIYCVAVVNRSSVDAYEGKPAFPEVMKRINDIDVIEIKNNKTSLTFVKKSNLWTLNEMPDLPVIQERISNLLTTVAGAKFYERKSDKAENLAFFNLLPIEDKASQVIRVSLKHDNSLIQTFNLGNIDIDLGRGSKAAYIRFDDQFQVWEIKADFIDMDTDWHQWTYSNLWDLRYGRLYSANADPKEEKVLMFLLKLLLNTPYIGVEEKPTVKPVLTYKLYVEGGDYVDLEFYRKDNKAYVVYKFDKNNVNPHLILLARYLGEKAVQIDENQMEKILEIIRK